MKFCDPNQKLFTLTRKGNAIDTEWAGYSRSKHIGPGDGTFVKMKM